jgi:hypothetical protein
MQKRKDGCMAVLKDFIISLRPRYEIFQMISTGKSQVQYTRHPKEAPSGIRSQGYEAFTGMI